MYKHHKVSGEKFPYTIVFIDSELPDMKGETLGLIIYDDPSINNAIRIFISPPGQSIDYTVKKNSGYNGFIPKPIKQSYLDKCLKTVLNISNENKSEIFSNDSDNEIET